MTLRRISPSTWLPIVAALALVLWAWQRLDFFKVSALVVSPDGTVQRWSNALATVDHPFHAARFSVFLDSLRDGGSPRWVFQHQGGYPSEFYPFGSAVMDLGVWVATLGQMSIPMIHTWSVALVFALPVVGFMVLPRLAGLSPWIGVAGAAVHLCVRGWWWSGGSYELVEWGLITNVLAAALVFLVLMCAAGLLDGRSPRLAGVAALLVAWSIWTNPRSAIALTTVVIAVCIVLALEGQLDRRRIALQGLPFVLGIGLAAPLIASLVRYNDLYFFVHYSGYASVGAWWDSSLQAVSGPVLVMALIGLGFAMATTVSVAERLVAWTLIVYLALTWWLVVVDWPGGWVEQLETTRLMPFQRLLMIAMACVGLGRLATLLAENVRPYAVAAVALLIPILYVIAPPGFIPESDRGLVRIGTMAEPGIVDLKAAVMEADNDAPPGTAILILGTTAYWHDHMWAKLWTDRLLYYDDWLWYWQQEHVGDYDPETEHAYAEDASALDPAFLRIHGIGAVVVTGSAALPAYESPDLALVRVGIYSVYTVRDFQTTATIDGVLTDVSIAENQVVISDIPAAGGTLVVRVNWFPRWAATAGGEDLAIRHRSDGYMELDVPPGVASVTLDYARTGLDWAMLVVAAVSLLGAIGFIVRPKVIAGSDSTSG